MNRYFMKNGLMIALIVALFFGVMVTKSAFAEMKSSSLAALKQAAEAGDAEAQYILGAMHSLGKTVKRDYAEAFKWFMKAAKQEDTEAQFSLGALYELGKGVKQSDTEAFQWYMKAAEQGNSFAMHSLGMMYSEGLGIKQDKTEANKWFKKAKENGYKPRRID